MTDWTGGLITWVLIIAMAVATPFLGACQPKAPEVRTTITGCEAFQVIRPSSKDTEDTKRQVLAYDLAYQKLCGAVHD